MSLLNQLTSITTRSQKRLGRGYGSGKGGHTVGRGQKGQKSRVGSKIPLWFEGGSLPLTKRLPMWRGKGRFKSLRDTAELTLADLEKMELVDISLTSLKDNKLIDPRFKKAKIINKGKLTRKINVEGIAVSAAAQKIIKGLGGTIK